MHYKTNRVNHDFQIAYFLAGSCQTADAAWSLLCDLRDDRKLALDLCEAAELRNEAKALRANSIIATGDASEILEARADLAELKAHKSTHEKNKAAAKDELAMICLLQSRLEPLRKYAHLPESEAHEAAQAEEWKLELIKRSENFMLSQGFIPSDHFSTMRMHPEFKTEIFPAIERLNVQIAEAKAAGKPIVSALPDAPKFLPLLLGSESEKR